MYDIIVVGGGTAGMTAALYALRNGKSVLVLEGDAIGGQIANSPKVENFPTIKEISGSEFADKLFEQISDAGAQFEFDGVVGISKENGVFTVATEYSSYQAKAVIAAVGVKHKHINCDGEKKLIGKGVYYCALCDGPFYKGKEVALIGDGNTALQYALVLSNICSKVYILTWFDKFFGDKALENAVRSKENIAIMPETSVNDFLGEDKLEKVVYTEKQSGDVKQLEVPAVFVAIGQVPKNDVFADLAELDSFGYFDSDESTCTKTEGFFVAGDCRKKSVRQLSTAVADGATAAIAACSYIDKM